ncbi:TRAP transporter large permease [Aestuariispira insulae]|uniref:TRAP transporter large permease protein n=1 Tax=Aestuariispira insulae TaxID=1461337 RepID=A0A3D9H8F2_9PROT|nr:TRAP transporter large permease [Aestuariispira insulae]RED45763.1 tripartite ATP-independent transporter DctM subunit [Aestuariispira insulae]
MSSYMIGLVAFACLFGLIAIRVPIAIAMGMVGLVGGWVLNGPDSIAFIMGSVPFESIFPYSLSVIPLFILMGVFSAHAGLSRSLYDAVHAFIGHFRGGLAMATVGACAAFGAICGSSLATAATMCRVAMPEMRRRGYDDGLASATIAAGGTLGVLIPPSVIMVIYAILTEQSIGRMFAAALIPGILATVLYMLAVRIRTGRNPALGPPDERVDWSGRLQTLLNVWPVLLLFGVVIGGIYAGWFSPTEAAAIGAIGAFLLALVRRQLNLAVFKDCLGETASTTGMIFLILIGTAVFNYFVETTGLPQALVAYVTGLGWNAYLILVLLVLFYIILGCFMDALSMILLTLPFVFPLVTSLGFDPIWFGVIMVSVVEVGLITPPVGMNLFVIMASTPGLKLQTVSRGVVAFLLADVVRLALLILFPALSLWLPAIMMD